MEEKQELQKLKPADWHYCLENDWNNYMIMKTVQLNWLIVSALLFCEINHFYNFHCKLICFWGNKHPLSQHIPHKPKKEVLHCPFIHANNTKHKDREYLIGWPIIYETKPNVYVSEK